MGVDGQPELAPRSLREADVVEVRMGEDQRAQVRARPADLRQRPPERVPGGGQAGIDDRDAVVVLDEVPVDGPVGDPVDAVGDVAFEGHAAGAIRSTERSTRAGDPAAMENGGRSRVTTEFAPITQRSPIVTPLVTTTCAPHHTLSAIRVGPLVLKPCQGTGLWGSSKRWLPSVTKQPLANMQCSPISTSSTAATMTFRFRNDPPPIRMRPGAGAVSQTPGSKSTCGPSSSRPSRSISSTSPWIGQRAKDSRRASSRWIAARRYGSVLRWYQRHFCSHRRGRRPPPPPPPPPPGGGRRGRPPPPGGGG